MKAGDASPRVKQLAKEQLSKASNAAHSELISCHSLAKAAAEEDKEDGDKQYRLVDNRQLAEALARSIVPPSCINLQTVAKHISWKRGHVQVEAVTAKEDVHRNPAHHCPSPWRSAGGRNDDSGRDIHTRYRTAGRCDKLIMGEVTKITIRFGEDLLGETGP